MACDILDLKCIIVNELVGSVTLTIIIGVILILMIASKLRWGFDATIITGVVSLFLFGLAIGNLIVILSFGAIMVALMVGWIVDTVTKNR